MAILDNKYIIKITKRSFCNFLVIIKNKIMNENIKVILAVIVALAIGLGVGYYYGNSTGLSAGIEQGIEKGRADILAEQKKAEEEKLARIVEEANPFKEIEETANPFKDAYKNPFAQ